MTDLTRQLKGKKIASVMTNGSTLLITTSDRTEITVSWVDHNGSPLKGRPVLSSKGWRLRAQGVQELLFHPAGRIVRPR